MSKPDQVVVATGGSGFIGSAVVRMLIQDTKVGVVNVDKLTYAENLRNVESVASSDRYQFVKVDICGADTMSAIFKRHDPDCVIHLAAESDVDRSIAGPLSKSPYGQYLIRLLGEEQAAHGVA